MIICFQYSTAILKTCTYFLLVLLRKALDPPDPDVVDDALNLLVHIHALQKPSPRSRPEPTFYGRLLSSFTLSFDSSVLILKFGAIGMLREGIILGILLDMQPLPILRPFGQDTLVLAIDFLIFRWKVLLHYSNYFILVNGDYWITVYGVH